MVQANRLLVYYYKAKTPYIAYYMYIIRQNLHNIKIKKALEKILKKKDCIIMYTFP